MSALTKSPSWKALTAHQNSLSGQSISGLFAENPDRFKEYSVESCGLVLDYSKNFVTAETIELFKSLTEEA